MRLPFRKAAHQVQSAIAPSSPRNYCCWCQLNSQHSQQRQWFATAPKRCQANPKRPKGQSYSGKFRDLRRGGQPLHQEPNEATMPIAAHHGASLLALHKRLPKERGGVRVDQACQWISPQEANCVRASAAGFAG